MTDSVATYVDREVTPGTIYRYQVSTFADRQQSPPTPWVSAQPRFAENVLVSVLDARQVEVSWTPPSGDGIAGDDIAGYHVERAVVEVVTDDQHRRIKKQTPPLELPSVCQIRRIGAFTRLTSQLQKEATFVDGAIDMNKPLMVEGEPLDERSISREDFDPSGRAYPFAVYAYRVRAVNHLGVVGGASPAVLTIPSSPQHVFAKEDGTTCHVKWAANREKNIKGYRVYRMDGRFNNEPITRQTADPISATMFSDPAAGKQTRRYYVVAVDALGQEGFPSSPVWFDREWQAFYKPFVGEWHQ
jgi:hypothetical protein